MLVGPIPSALVRPKTTYDRGQQPFTAAERVVYLIVLFRSVVVVIVI
jgi:hypothetical protein